MVDQAVEVVENFLVDQKYLEPELLDRDLEEVMVILLIVMVMDQPEVEVELLLLGLIPQELILEVMEV
jgi:hypothetical protein